MRHASRCPERPGFRARHVATSDVDTARRTRVSASEHWFESQPNWFKTAVFYELHTRAFFDSSDDGHGRLPRASLEARLPPVARDRLHLAAAVLSLAAQGRGLRHLRLPHGEPRVRHRRRVRVVRRVGARARDAGDHRLRDEPHLERAPVVPGVAARPRLAEGRLVRLVGHRAPLRGRADHLRRQRAVQLDMGSAARGLLLAPLLQPPARPQLREPRGRRGDARRAPLLARPRARRLPARRRAVPLRGGGHELREPAADACVPEAGSRGGRRGVLRPCAARRGEPVARGRRRLLRGRGRVPHGVPLPRHAADVHGAPAGGGAPDRRDPRPHAADPRRTASGASSCATTTS